MNTPNFPPLQQTWRWFGPNDGVNLAEIKQTGAKGIVSALHHIPCGDVWSPGEILMRKQLIEKAGLQWAVVESVNIHESIKTGLPEREQYLENYRITLRNLAQANIKIVCYNFMPVLDWTRTHLRFRQPDGSEALRYDANALVAFELFMLKRKEAFTQYTPAQQSAAKAYFEALTPEETYNLQQTIMAGLPGTDDVFSIPEFEKHLAVYREIGPAELKQNLAYFLQSVVPVAEECGIKLCIHPDDPPFPILGLPRVVSTEQDLADLLQFAPSPSNGLTFCTGSLGARPDNDLPGIVERLGSHIHFIHLRNVKREPSGSFFEAEHLGGSTDMAAVMRAIVAEQAKRAAAGRPDVAIPMRPDHGHQFTFDANRRYYPGYSLIGRMRGLAELRGLEAGIRSMMG